MMEMIEQKGKPCCINMITSEDKKFLQGLTNAVKKVERAKQREELKATIEAQGDQATEEEAAEH